MELILIRHAQPAWVSEGTARNNPPLTELGREQAALVAKRASRWDGVTQLLVSPLLRARETAAPVAAALGLEPTVQPWMEEIRNPADWEGSPVDTIVQILEKARQRPIDELWDGLPGGESFREFHERICTGLESTLAARGARRLGSELPHLWDIADAEGRLVIVAHGGSNAVILGALLGLEPVPWEWERFASRHTSLAWLTTGRIADGYAFGLRAFGDVAHLPPEMITD